LSSFSSESGGALESFKATLDFTLEEAGWVATNGSASTSQGSWRNRTFDTTETQSNSGSWGVSGSGSGESWSGTSKTDRHTMSTFRHTYREDYDYQCSNAITYNADGSVSYSPDQANDVAGSYSDRGTGYWRRSDWWSPSSGSGSGGGSGGGSSSSSSSSADGGSSYSETVSYPGFFEEAYYGGGPAGGGGGLIEYIGDIFIDGSGAGYVGMTMAMEGDGGSAALDLEAAASEKAGPAVAAEEFSDLSGQDSVLPWRAAPDSAPQFGGDAFATGSPMWGRQGGLGLFSPQRNGPAIVIDVDRAGNIRAITDALGNRAAYGYDLAGNVTSATATGGNS
jgi:YD repeat-containing protein